MATGCDYASIDGNAPPRFPQAKAAGLRFTYRRAAYGTWTDPQWSRDRAAVRQAGIVDGPYLFLRYDDERKKPEVQADAFIAAVGHLTRLDLPPCLDVEFPQGRAVTGMTITEAVDWTHRAWSRLRDHYGVAPVIYTSARVWWEELEGRTHSDFADSAFWLAKPWPRKVHGVADLSFVGVPETNHGGHVIPYGAQWFFYQYQGDALGYPGFIKTVDIDLFRTSKPGDQGAHIIWLQKQLGLTLTGLFDDELTEAVKEVQLKYNLLPDGIIGPKTFAPIAWNRLCEKP